MGNSTLCLVVWKSGPEFRRVPFNIYLVALAVTDLLLAVVSLPVYVMSSSIYQHPEGKDGLILCKIITGYLLQFWLAGVSVFLLVIISFERCSAIRNPFQARTRTTSRKTAIYISAAWSIGIFINLPMIIGVKYSKSHPNIGNYCAYDWSPLSLTFYACTFMLQFLIPAIIFIVNFYRVRKYLGKLDDNLKSGFESSGQMLRALEQKKKTVRIVFVVSAAFFVCWTPNNVMYFMFQYGGSKDITWDSALYQIGIILGFLNSCINPFLYAFQSDGFRNHCRKVLRELFATRKAVISNMTSSYGSLAEESARLILPNETS